MFSEANPLKGFIRTLVNWSLAFKNTNTSIEWSCHYLYSQSYEGGGRFSWFPSVWASWVLAGEAVFESSHHPAGDKVVVSLGSVRGKIEYSVIGIFSKKIHWKRQKWSLKFWLICQDAETCDGSVLKIDECFRQAGNEPYSLTNLS